MNFLAKSTHIDLSPSFCLLHNFHTFCPRRFIFQSLPCSTYNWKNSIKTWSKFALKNYCEFKMSKSVNFGTGATKIKLKLPSKAAWARSLSSWFLSGWTRMESLLYFVLVSSILESGSICRTSKGFKLKYDDPGRKSRSICCFGVKTESLFSMCFTWNYSEKFVAFQINRKLHCHSKTSSNYEFRYGN